MNTKHPTKALSVFPVILAGLALATAAQAQQAPGAAGGEVAKPPAMTPEEEKAADMRMPELDRSGLLPKLRLPETVESGERNPFAVASKALERFAGIVTDTERDRIERLLRSLRISGVSESAGGRRALLGPFPLAEGQELPPLFADQVERLVTRKIDDKEVVLEFVSSDPGEPGQNVSLPIRLSSGAESVRSLLFGEAFRKVVPLNEEGATVLPPLTSGTAEAVLQEMEAAELQSLVNRRTELLDAAAGVSADEGEQR